MYYIVKCPECDSSDLEILKDRLRTFKCLDCNHEFYDTNIEFDLINNYEINQPIETKPCKTVEITSKLTRVIKQNKEIL